MIVELLFKNKICWVCLGGVFLHLVLHALHNFFFGGYVTTTKG